MATENEAMDAVVDWDFWGRPPGLKAAEAARLMLRMDPQNINITQARKFPEYKRLIKILLREKGAQTTLAQEYLFDMCDQLRLKMPSELRESYYRRHPKENPLKRTMIASIESLKAKNRELEAEARNITKLSIMFYAMSVDEYGYDPLRAKNVATKLIIDATAALDDGERLKTSPNTVRSWLERARKTVAAEIKRIKEKERRQAKAQTGKP